jgi:hypothetical protein
VRLFKDHLLIILCLALIFIFLTFPLITMCHDVLPGKGDIRHLTWVMAWVIHQFFHDPLHLFDANILYDNQYILASADHLVGSALLGLPIYLITGNIALLFNGVFFLGFVLSGYTMYLLAWHCTANKYAAFIAGVFYAFLPYRFHHLSHPHMFNTIWIPLTFLYFDKFLRSRKISHCAFFGLFFTLSVLSSWYLGLYLAVLLPIYFAVFMFISRGWRTLKTILAGLAVTAVLSAALLYPFAHPYLHNADRHGFDRRLAVGADLKDYYGMPIYDDGWYSQAIGLLAANDYPLFIGWLGILLLGTGLVYGRGAQPGIAPSGRVKAGHYGLFIAVALAAFLFSFGKSIQFGGTTLLPGPYQVLYYLVPGFNGLRRAGRFIMFVTLAGGVLISFGYVKIESWLTRTKKFTALGLCLITTLVMVSEFRALYIRPAKMKMTFVAPDPKPYAVWLAAQEDDPVILNLPMHENMADESRYMIDSVHHWRRMVNGYTAFVPASYRKYKDLAGVYPSEESLRVLKEEGIRYVLLHAGEFDDWRAFKTLLARSRALPHRLKCMGRFGTVYIFQII